MNITFSGQFKKSWERWVKKRNRAGNPQTLDSHNLYILPSKFGWAYGVVVITTLVGAVNSQINTIFLMTFLLAIIGMISALEAHANLKDLSFKFIVIKDSQQGIPVKITLFIQANRKRRFGVEFQIASQPKTRLEKIPLEGIEFIVPVETPMRGRFLLPPITISSLFPFGIFRVWSYLYFEEHYYVYPQPINPGFWPSPYHVDDIKQKHVSGDEEFYDLKQVENPWMEPKLIHWRIAAKGQGWFHKTMHSNEVDYWLFKLNDLPSRDIEFKLQNLSYWLQAAETNGMVYGLELKTAETKFARGHEHLEHCLRQLALYQ
ncbi:MAG: hypothetical protein V4501_06235 [Pseudomonadota bacterium]